METAKTWRPQKRVGVSMISVDFLESVARKAGDFAKQYHGKALRKDKGFSNKTSFEREKNAFSFVDVECQRIIMQVVGEVFPAEVGIIAEETGGQITTLQENFCHVGRLVNSKYTLIVDPIDGTSNFCAATPLDGNHDHRKGKHNYWGVSLALARGNEVVAGVIYYPTLGDGIILKTGKGIGTSLNGTKIMLAKTNPFKPTDSMRCGTFAKRRQFQNHFPNQEHYGAFTVTTLALFKGAGANFPFLQELPPLNWYIGKKTNICDVSCSQLAYVEAGGSVSDVAGKPLNLLAHVGDTNNGLAVMETYLFTPNEQYRNDVSLFLSELA
jgi:fructose-1,6-bisphosphatase/inositol monophosphatase family enzyme